MLPSRTRTSSTTLLHDPPLRAPPAVLFCARDQQPLARRRDDPAAAALRAVLPSAAPAHTELLDLRPLPSRRGQPQVGGLFKFSTSTRCRRRSSTPSTTPTNVLIGSPTGSGKTVSAELSVLRLLRAHPGMKAVYIAPLKALVRERMLDWGAKFVQKLGYSLQELTGDMRPTRARCSSDIPTTTPEKWDGVSRDWRGASTCARSGWSSSTRSTCSRGARPDLEVTVSRMRYISTKTGQPVRIVGLSTAMATRMTLPSGSASRRMGSSTSSRRCGRCHLRCTSQASPASTTARGWRR